MLYNDYILANFHGYIKSLFYVKFIGGTVIFHLKTLHRIYKYINKESIVLTFL